MLKKKLKKLKIIINHQIVEIESIMYAAAFLSRYIIDVKFEKDNLIIISSKSLNESKIKKQIRLLENRYSKNNDNVEVVYDKKFKKKKLNFLKILNTNNLLVKIDRGLYVYKNEFYDLINFLDHYIRNYYGKHFSSIDESYPNMIKLESLRKANHLSSFPEHLLFNFHLNEDLNVLDSFAKKQKIKKFNQLGEIKYVQNPSTCFHCYAIRENKKINRNISITSVTKCNRYESANNDKIERLVEFSLREVIFLGTRDYINKTRNDTLALTKKLAEKWDLSGKIVSSNDPFFTNDFKNKSFFQLKLNLKYEFRCDIPSLKRQISIMSSNIHGDTFSKNFNIKKNDKNIQTGCMGFGLERFAMVIIAQHGINKEYWPKNLLKDFNNWKKCNQ